MALDKRSIHMQVLCAANTVIMVLLVGVVILQIGEWWIQVSVIAPIEAEEARIAQQAALLKAEKKDQ